MEEMYLWKKKPRILKKHKSRREDEPFRGVNDSRGGDIVIFGGPEKINCRASRSSKGGSNTGGRDFQQRRKRQKIYGGGKKLPEWWKIVREKKSDFLFELAGEFGKKRGIGSIPALGRKGTKRLLLLQKIAIRGKDAAFEKDPEKDGRNCCKVLS